METKKIMINIPSDMHQEFKTIAFFRNITMTDILLQKIKEVIAEEKKKGEIPRIKK